MGVLQTPPQTRGRGLTALSAGTVSAPAPGYRDSGSGALWGVGGHGYSWSSSFTGPYPYRLYFNSGAVYPNGGGYRAYGFPLRCLQE